MKWSAANRLHGVVRSLYAGMTLILAPVAPAQDYPNRPIRFLVGVAPGGGTDFMARLVGQKTPEITRRLAGQGAEPAGTTPAEFARYVEVERVRWLKVVREAKITAN